MEIIQVTTITLEDKEIDALQTLKRAYDDCVCNDCFECEECPLYYNGGCMGQHAETVLRKQEGKKK